MKHILRLSLPKIYPLTDTSLSGLAHAEQVRELIEGGASFVQIRDKDASSDEFYRSVDESMNVAAATGTKIIVNDRVDIAMATGAHGVHLGQADLRPAEARKLLGDRAIIGISTHSIEQMKQALEMPVDYIAFGPIWTTTTKEDPDPVVGLDLLHHVKNISGNVPLVAIGGITESNLAATISAGADCVAIISDLYRGPDSIADRYRRLSETASV